MFDFQKLDVYQKAKAFHSTNKTTIRDYKVDPISKNQLSRASLSVPLNIAEGAGKFTKPDKRKFYIIARASLFECVAILEILRDEEVISGTVYDSSEKEAENLSRMLFTMIRNLER